ncbi:MAG: uroporphyrinogen decarboxylase family protein [bacterium]
MTRIDDIRQALACGEPVDVPVWELEFHLWDAFAGRRLMLGHEFVGLTAAEQERALHVNAEIMAGVATELGFAAVTAPGGYWEHAPGVPAYFWLPDPARDEQIRLLARLAEGRFLVAAESGGVLCMPGAADYLDFSYRLFDAPEQVDEQARATLRQGVERARILRELGAELLFTASDIADNHGVFFNPEQMERFILPYLREWTGEVKTLGGWSVLHSDGNLDACVEALADSGLCALQAIDPVAGMDMRAVKQRVAGRLCLCGNVDCGLLITGTPDQVRAATARLLADCAPGGGLVLGASNAVQPDVPVANYRAMLAAWQAYDQGRPDGNERQTR